MYFDYDERRARLARTLQLTDEIVIIGAGSALSKPELSDQMLPFIAHQEYYYLTGLGEAIGGILVFDPRDRSSAWDSGWISFVPRITEADHLWEGRLQLSGDFLDRFDAWFEARNNRRVIMLGAPVPGIEVDWQRTGETREAYLHLRRFKDSAEIDLMRHGAYKTAAGYAAIRPMLKVGFTERRIQVEIEAEYFRRGATKTGYDTVVGSGPNSAVFHALPSQRPFKEGEFVLIDSGAEIDRYVIDVTRTYVVGNKPTAFQRDLHHAVLHAQTRAIDRCVPGAEWKDIHLAAAADLVSGLVYMGVMKGSPWSLIEQHAHTLFFPHGIGHMVGLGVRDASGMEPGRSKDSSPALAHLRMDLPLRSSYIVTVEPGLYFIPALLNNPLNREIFHDCVNWDVADKYIGIGGVRIEDTILINHGPPEILTRIIPKTL